METICTPLFLLYRTLCRLVLSIFVLLLSAAPSAGARLSTIPQSIHCKVEHQAVCKQGLVFELRVSRPRCLLFFGSAAANRPNCRALCSHIMANPYLTGNPNFNTASMAMDSLLRELRDFFFSVRKAKETIHQRNR